VLHEAITSLNRPYDGVHYYEKNWDNVGKTGIVLIEQLILGWSIMVIKAGHASRGFDRQAVLHEAITRVLTTCSLVSLMSKVD
jgi:hypothetical protein